MTKPEPTGHTGLPALAEIFHALRRGRHISAVDGHLFTHLSNHYAAYHQLLQELGFTLTRHARDFFYLEDQTNFTDIAGRMALFVFVLVESLADKGQPIEETLMTRPFTLGDLPHLATDRYRDLMREADVTTTEQLYAIVNYLDRYGFVRRKPDDLFEFLSPTYRYLDICMEYANRESPPETSPASDPDDEETFQKEASRE